jgi:hypothetical protein
MENPDFFYTANAAQVQGVANAVGYALTIVWLRVILPRHSRPGQALTPSLGRRVKRDAVRATPWQKTLVSSAGRAVASDLTAAFSDFLRLNSGCRHAGLEHDQRRDPVCHHFALLDAPI